MAYNGVQYRQFKGGYPRKVIKMEIEIYKNYGCLAAEKRAVYTYNNPAGTAVCWDKMTVQTPKDWETCKNRYGQPLIRPKGQEYWWLINEVLSGDKAPMFIYCGEDENGFPKIYKEKLEIINEN